MLTMNSAAVVWACERQDARLNHVIVVLFLRIPCIPLENEKRFYMSTTKVWYIRTWYDINWMFSIWSICATSSQGWHTEDRQPFILIYQPINLHVWTLGGSRSTNTDKRRTCKLPQSGVQTKNLLAVQHPTKNVHPSIFCNWSRLQGPAACLGRESGFTLGSHSHSHL